MSVCIKCTKKKGCDIPCEAYYELNKIWDAQDEADKKNIVRNLRKILGVQDAEVSRSLKMLADKIIKKYSEFSFIKEWNVKIGYVISHEKKNGEKITYADCRKVPVVYKAYLPFDFIITFYEYNTDALNENQLKVLMYHELKHITMGERGLKLRPHDIEDFNSILDTYGLDWNGFGKEIPDMLGGE